ncbi:hypothetical protein CRE_04475 [Caenorhabditis remanei]|uniref:RBR-type E3 ubiquitin transferase n=1 Tax=Caenorhabditis remanei TaxID=31234 RepID=E3NUS7_CAERE|nr:hypothetical protein CRE_04475 [Caenorhabditis remanei]
MSQNDCQEHENEEKDYGKDYRSLNAEQLESKLKTLISNVAVIFELSDEQCLKLLQKYNYDKERLLEEGYSGEDALKSIEDVSQTSEHNDRQAMINDYVTKSRYLKWCPNGGCTRAIEVDYADIRTVRCSCQMEFCFSCDRGPHDPVPCDLLSHWLENNQRDSLEKIIFESKPCPKCGHLIQPDDKEDMKTGSVWCLNEECRQQFCWYCGVEWVGEHYDCEDFELPLNEKHEKLVSDFKRYSRYHELFTTQKENLEMEEAVRTYDNLLLKYTKFQLREKIESRETKTQYLQETLSKLLDCFRTLMYSYVLEFYLKEECNANIFKQIREDLQTDSAKLLEMFLKLEEVDDSIETKKIVQEMGESAVKKRINLLRNCAEEMKNDNWTFDEHKFIEM